MPWTPQALSHSHCLPDILPPIKGYWARQFYLQTFSPWPQSCSLGPRVENRKKGHETFPLDKSAPIPEAWTLSGSAAEAEEGLWANSAQTLLSGPVLPAYPIWVVPDMTHSGASQGAGTANEDLRAPAASGQPNRQRVREAKLQMRSKDPLCPPEPRQDSSQTTLQWPPFGQISVCV